MKHFYLVDFENVSDAGLNGFFDLTGTDTAYLFYSQKANRISIDFFKTLLEHRAAAQIFFFKVAAGNQALDLQLASFLGSLIAENPTDCDFCIISKDKGYACLSSFWLNRGDSARLFQAGSISEALALRARAAKAAEAKLPQPESAPAPAESAPAPANREAPAPQNEEAPASPEAPEAAVPAAEESAQESAPAKAEAPEVPAVQPARRSRRRPSKPAAQNPQNAEPPRQDHAPEPKPASEEAKPRPVPAPPSEKTLLNAKVQQTLSKAKYDTKIIAQVASMTSKTFGDPKIKQLVYRGLIKQHGQKTGLEIYNLIKPLL